MSSAINARTSTPPMGWNSYNYYGCNPNENIIKTNAQGLVDLGLADLGYTYVTTDCGWPAQDRDAEGRIQFNETLFPSGGKGLGDFIHGLGLKYGLYSGAGYLQCGSTTLPASLGMISPFSLAETPAKLTQIISMGFVTVSGVIGNGTGTLTDHGQVMRRLMLRLFQTGEATR
jgi:hypothetical protein